ncbi:magnesium transporter CorA family protein [Prosthecomicrobium hirschii]|uniref:Magnesium transport protein CorA n=1 Tax=Prosthecodimorpha hirschii TaxID=665126 RepID=A0A0P6VRU8_9HYPH|nr:magnesium transporter CorA family protein [Prosthecomicrobium hirschii]KPL55454.1 hypothetical protein ABB55_27110 [Prosthecomicrobium hirschii]MCW1839563.1 magnesium transporter CorA family protein [Prosthecomicrobium hirschii]TPQ51865.1 magnesium transporter [Prosthecomicrobium hirschii]
MIQTYRLASGRLQRIDDVGPAGTGDIVWLDLCNPTREEEHAVEAILGLVLPTRQEMAEIEESARLYAERGALVMTAVVIDGVAEGHPGRSEVTFLLSQNHFVTLRYSNPMPFRTIEARIGKQADEALTAPALFVTLLESFIERIADVLEAVATDLNAISDTIFYDDDEVRESGKARPAPDMQRLIRLLGRKNRMLSILRESLLSFGRLVPFVREGGAEWMKNGVSVRLKAVDRDIKSLATYEGQLEQQVAYLHESTLGLINVEQNTIIKVFSVAAVLFLPPTLVGTVYGMNFEVMPELKWAFGYPFALVTMVLSAFVPYWWFKRRGWL